MQTRCPHCDTKFRVTEIQLQAADGIVRCGICNEVFNAIEVAGKHQSSLLEDVTVKEPPTEAMAAEAVSLTPPPSPLAPHRDHDNPLMDIKDPNHFNPLPASDEPDKDTFDFFNEESNKSLPHVVPDQFRDAYAPATHSLTSTVFWSIGTLLLTATLIIEYTWFNRDQLNKVPQLQEVFRLVCQHVKCENISIRDPENIELITRNIFSHPSEKGALMVSVTLKNNAAFAQPYPVMQIDFSDIRGKTIVARRFWPNEYLDLEPPYLLPANTDASISLEIQDPGKQAMTYEFNFL